MMFFRTVLSSEPFPLKYIPDRTDILFWIDINENRFFFTIQYYIQNNFLDVGSLHV